VPATFYLHVALIFEAGTSISWLLDGVTVPNRICIQVGPQFDPKDIAISKCSEVGYNAEDGDRTYGVVKRGNALRIRAQPTAEN